MSQTTTEPGPYYFTARRILILALAVLLGAEFAGLSISAEKPLEIAGTSLGLQNPSGLVYLLVFVVVYAMYEHQVEWLVFRESGQPSRYRLMDYKLLSFASYWSLVAFYFGETIRHWNTGWVPHALATGFSCLFFAVLTLSRRKWSVLRGDASPKWAVRILGFACLFLVVAEPVSHQVPFLHWLAVMLLPLSMAAFLVINDIGSRPVDWSKSDNRG